MDRAIFGGWHDLSLRSPDPTIVGFRDWKRRTRLLQEASYEVRHSSADTVSDETE